MKKLITVLALLCAGTIASAVPMTITFKGADIVDKALAGNTTGVPMVGDGYVSSATGVIRTYAKDSTPGNPGAFDAWIDSFGSAQGISGFNLWLQDGASNQAALWGETLALTDPYSTAITPFASTGWTASVYTLQVSDWGAAWAGKQLITYTANNASAYLRLGTDVQFGFTADVMGNNGATGPVYQIWVGADGSGIVSSNNADYFQRAITAKAVPDTASLLTILLGLGSLFLFRRHRV